MRLSASPSACYVSSACRNPLTLRRIRTDADVSAVDDRLIRDRLVNEALIDGLALLLECQSLELLHALLARLHQVVAARHVQLAGQLERDRGAVDEDGLRRDHDGQEEGTEGGAEAHAGLRLKGMVGGEGGCDGWRRRGIAEGLGVFIPCSYRAMAYGLPRHGSSELCTDERNVVQRPLSVAGGGLTTRFW